MIAKTNKKDDMQTRLLQDILITQLGTLGVSQQDIRKIVGVDMHRVSRIVRYIKRARTSAEK